MSRKAKIMSTVKKCISESKSSNTNIDFNTNQLKTTNIDFNTNQLKTTNIDFNVNN